MAKDLVIAMVVFTLASWFLAGTWGHLVGRQRSLLISLWLTCALITALFVGTLLAQVVITALNQQ